MTLAAVVAVLCIPALAVALGTDHLGWPPAPDPQPALLDPTWLNSLARIGDDVACEVFPPRGASRERTAGVPSRPAAEAAAAPRGSRTRAGGAAS